MIPAPATSNSATANIGSVSKPVGRPTKAKIRLAMAINIPMMYNVKAVRFVDIFLNMFDKLK